MRKPTDRRETIHGKAAKLSERDERSLSMLCEGELPDRDAELLRSRLGTEPALRAQFETLCTIRDGVRLYVGDSVCADAEALAARNALWSRIEQQLRPELAESRVGAPSPRRRLRIADLLGLRPLAVSLGAAAAVLVYAQPWGAPVALVRVDSGGRPTSEGIAPSALPAVRLADASGEESLVLPDQLSMIAAAGAVPRDDEPAAPMLVAVQEPQPDLLARAGIDDIQPELSIDSEVPEDLVARLMPTSEVKVAGEPAGGYRAGGVDIAWIHSERPVRLVSTRRDTAVSAPVVWVSRPAAHR